MINEKSCNNYLKINMVVVVCYFSRLQRIIRSWAPGTRRPLPPYWPFYWLLPIKWSKRGWGGDVFPALTIQYKKNIFLVFFDIDLQWCEIISNLYPWSCFLEWSVMYKIIFFIVMNDWNIDIRYVYQPFYLQFLFFLFSGV